MITPSLLYKYRGWPLRAHHKYFKTVIKIRNDG